ncbi:MAG: beta-lactamase family protein [Thermoflexales bacterium]|nr:beta-lactamase family protein [Thermoflexales bacterium]
MTDRFEPLRQHLTHLVEAGELDGVGISVAHRGEQVLGWSAGRARPDLPASAATVWPVASISKSYTAAVIMALVERGALTLTTAVSAVLPRFRGEGREAATLRQLLTHTAGMIYESPEMEARLAAQTPYEALVEEAYSQPLAHAPGTGFAYSDYHYLMAAEMARAVTGRSLVALAQELVFAPAGLGDTFFNQTPANAARIATVRGVQAEGTVGAMYNTPYARGLAHPAFGVLATTDDLMRFGLHFAPRGPRFLSEATVRAMQTDHAAGCLGHAPALGQQLVPPYPVPWGLGFYFQHAGAPGAFGDLVSFGSFGHGGASGCQLVIDPANDIVIAFTSNCHARLGRERWAYRQRSAINLAVAAVTRRA